MTKVIVEARRNTLGVTYRVKKLVQRLTPEIGSALSPAQVKSLIDSRNTIVEIVEKT